MCRTPAVRSIGRAQPLGPGRRGTSPYRRPGHQVQRLELVDADDPPVLRRTVVEGEDALLLRQTNCGSLECFHVLVFWNEIPAVRSTSRIVS